MKISYLFPAILSLVLCFASGIFADENEDPIEISMADGQLRSNPIRVYVANKKLTRAMKPDLCLARLRTDATSRNDTTLCTEKSFKPREVASNQQWIDNSSGTEVTKTGTLLIFDLNKFDIDWYLSGTRVVPILHWNEPDAATANGQTKMTLVSEEAVYISNGGGAIFWTVITLAAILGLASWITRSNGKSLLGLIIIKKHVSMSLTQMALWTLAVGAVVLGFGIMRLKVPDIPDNLVLLMGFATGTSAAGHWQVSRGQRLKKKEDELKAALPKKSDEESNNDEDEPLTLAEKFKTLIMVNTGKGVYEPSIAKAQMLFWTLATLSLFVVKSLLEGELWDIPTQLVALMGVSQVGFLSRKEMSVAEQSKNVKELEKEAKKKES